MMVCGKWSLLPFLDVTVNITVNRSAQTEKKRNSKEKPKKPSATNLSLQSLISPFCKNMVMPMEEKYYTEFAPYHVQRFSLVFAFGMEDKNKGNQDKRIADCVGPRCENARGHVMLPARPG